MQCNMLKKINSLELEVHVEFTILEIKFLKFYVDYDIGEHLRLLLVSVV